MKVKDTRESQQDVKRGQEISVEPMAVGHEHSEVPEHTTTIQLRDGGYAWTVLSALFISNVITAGYVKSFGMTFNALLNVYPETSTTMSGVMIGLLAGCRSTFAPISGAISNKFGARVSLIGGTVICFSGLIASLFCTTIAQLTVTLGIMMGVGICMVEACQVVIISDYFESKLSTANGIRVAGNPLGGMLYPFLLVYLLDMYGVTLLRLIIAGIFLNILVCMSVIRPPSTHRKIQILDNVKSNKEKLSDEDRKLLYQRLQASVPEVKRQAKRPLDFRIFRNPVYFIFIATVMCISVALPIVLYYLPIYGRSIKLSPTQNSILLSFFAAFDFIMRLSMGFLSDKKIFKKNHIFSFTLITGGVGVLFIPLCSTMWTLIMATGLFSLGSAGYFSFINVILTDQFGKGTIATTWGFVRMSQGIFNFLFPPLLGYVVDATGGFTISFIMMGCGLSAAGFILLMEPLLIKLTKSDIIIS